jgi:hypothetical protein
MSTQLKPEEKAGFDLIDKYSRELSEEESKKIDKEEKSIARLWNDDEGRGENKVWKLIKSSGKGFYDGSAEALFLNKKENKVFLVTANTSYGRSWKSPDRISIKGIRCQVNC